MTAPKQLDELVERFRRELSGFKSGAYNETQARVEFIDSMFELLGWDGDNRLGHAQHHKGSFRGVGMTFDTAAPGLCLSTCR